MSRPVRSATCTKVSAGLRCRECLQDPKPVYQRLGDRCAIRVDRHAFCSECEYLFVCRILHPRMSDVKRFLQRKMLGSRTPVVRGGKGA